MGEAGCQQMAMESTMVRLLLMPKPLNCSLVQVQVERLLPKALNYMYTCIQSKPEMQLNSAAVKWCSNVEVGLHWIVV